LRAQTFSDNTNRTYSTHLRAYMTFCRLIKIQPVPISQINLARYIAYLEAKLAFTSIKQYLNIVRLIHLENGLPNPLKSSWYIQSLLSGCKRALGNQCKPKLPMTLTLLEKMFQVLDLASPFHLVFWAACLLALFSFLRKSNLFFGHSVGGHYYLKRGDISFLAQGATLHISHSKTIQYRERQLVVPVPRIPGSHLCPTTALRLVLKLVSAPADAPLLAYPTATGPKALSYGSFVSHLKSVLQQLGIDPSLYSGHSFRRGGASLALSCNLPCLN
jgi:hypothetical protein